VSPQSHAKFYLRETKAELGLEAVGLISFTSLGELTKAGSNFIITNDLSFTSN